MAQIFEVCLDWGVVASYAANYMCHHTPSVDWYAKWIGDMPDSDGLELIRKTYMRPLDVRRRRMSWIDVPSNALGTVPRLPELPDSLPGYVIDVTGKTGMDFDGASEHTENTILDHTLVSFRTILVSSFLKLSVLSVRSTVVACMAFTTTSKIAYAERQMMFRGILVATGPTL